MNPCWISWKVITIDAKQIIEIYDLLMERGKPDEARLLLYNWVYYITHKEEIEKSLAERITND